jgi:hypothetical protein
MMQPAQGEHDICLEFLLAAVLGKCSFVEDAAFEACVRGYCATGTADYLLAAYKRLRS